MDEHDWNNRDAGQSFSFEPAEETGAPRKTSHRKSHTGLVCLLIVLAISGGAVACCMSLGMQLQFDRFDGGFALSLVSAEEQEQNQTQVDHTGTAPSAPEEQTPSLNPANDTAVNIAAPSTDDRLPTASGVEPGNLSISEESEMLTLQQIYQKMIVCVASISAVSDTSVSSGSGIVLTEDGYIATNAHVISGASVIRVTLHDEMQYEARLIGSDAVSDLAVLKIEATGLAAAEFGDSDLLQVGDSVVAIGDPLGAELRGTMTDGIISAINRDLQVDGRSMTLIQTNAALNEGNSGGPLINMQGQVIGINTMKMSSSYSSIEGLGFAIPSTLAIPILDELMAQGYISGRPALGFDGITVPSYARIYYRLPAGVYVQDVESGSSAAQQGISPGDVVTEFNGEAIESLDDLKKATNACSAGDTISVVIYRRGYYYQVELVLEEATG